MNTRTITTIQPGLLAWVVVCQSVKKFVQNYLCRFYLFSVVFKIHHYTALGDKPCSL
mgnify:CR=1 FL=1